MTVSQFRARFGDEAECGRHLTAQRWPNGFVCPRCGSRSRGYMARRRVHECAGCGYQSSVTAGTIFHKTRTPLTSWFWAIYRMSQDKKGISALQLSKEIGVSYPTAWLMQHKIRKAMADRDQGYQLQGLIEVDEGYVGGAEQGEAQKGRGAQTKSVVAVAVERLAPGQEGEKPIPGFAALAVVANAAASSLHRFLYAKVQPGSQVMSDGWRGVPGAGAARLSAYRHALTRRSAGRASTLSLGAHYPVQPQALSAGHAPQSRTATPPTLRGRIQLPAQPPHDGD